MFLVRYHRGSYMVQPLLALKMSTLTKRTTHSKVSSTSNEFPSHSFLGGIPEPPFIPLARDLTPLRSWIMQYIYIVIVDVRGYIFGPSTRAMSHMSISPPQQPLRYRVNARRFPKSTSAVECSVVHSYTSPHTSFFFCMVRCLQQCFLNLLPS